MLTYFLGGAVEMLTVADMGEGGVKNGQKSADVLYGRPHINFLQVVACVATAIGAANDCYPCVCEAVEWTCGCDIC